MEDFAKACGLSRPTLAKFFDDPASVRPATRKRIEAALAQSDYRPNPFARNLNRRRARTIGIVVPTVADPFYAALVALLEEHCRSAGFWPLVLSSRGEAEGEALALRTLLDQRVSGALIASCGADALAEPARTLGERMPLVFLDSASGAAGGFVGNDNGQSVAALVDYLAEGGEAPAYLDMPDVNASARERRARYLSRMAERGLAPHRITPPGNGWDFERLGFEAMEAILQTGPPRFRSLLCANDRLALGALAAAFARGVTIGQAPGALRIAGHDDHPLSRYACPALTTMAQDVEAHAALATRMLLDALRDGPEAATRILLPARLTVRASA
ncbi:LacI family DNA-binding transcriptional regulator [Aureimonas phyllosphaerae]|uniref:DNA-binding LacI/PurR family transcriptional regulator n=1 Tax=Aureimonas phyllosphaerae TaxID=1166078 RepID=A0A7W6BZF7_9HYPH|nr:LacI family DNA-binding transcriptional regulator [Aureimonas phyllosphaerae]MBB3935622.1 DNA-binding LacI/PurR family transcriptional regulator [Aureimonas phyllosphaerae]MBB3959630.1 DNA-binding LacI/PurR family transcriptional regulator [Aureimonas phyllosphaerae]SFF13086.1 DNA-binding transcriptional regulator, LacI/PurR family [Aureimonas phyllosphaerae]